jgi:4-hydroxybenzoate polyprenyltransferase
MRGAGCTINDMWDEKFDKAVGGSFHVNLKCMKRQMLMDWVFFLFQQRERSGDL